MAGLTKKQMEKALKDIEFGKMMQAKQAALTLVIREHIETISMMSLKEREDLLEQLGQPKSFYVTLLKEVAVFRYSQIKR